LPARDEPGRWEPESLLVDLPRVGRHAPGVIPPTSAWWARDGVADDIVAVSALGTAVEIALTVVVIAPVAAGRER